MGDKTETVREYSGMEIAQTNCVTGRSTLTYAMSLNEVKACHLPPLGLFCMSFTLSHTCNIILNVRTFAHHI